MMRVLDQVGWYPPEPPGMWDPEPRKTIYELAEIEWDELCPEIAEDCEEFLADYGRDGVVECEAYEVLEDGWGRGPGDEIQVVVMRLDSRRCDEYCYVVWLYRGRQRELSVSEVRRRDEVLDLVLSCLGLDEDYAEVEWARERRS